MYIRGKIAYEHGHILGAICWNKDELANKLPEDKILIIYCSIGENSIVVAQDLQMQGYKAYSLKDGFRTWLLRSSDELSPIEVQKYDRQIILPQLGNEGQKKLKNAKVLIVGAGGLGAPTAVESKLII